MVALPRRLNIKELAELLRTSTMTVERWLRDDPSFPRPAEIGRKKLWDRTEVESYIRRQAV